MRLYIKNPDTTIPNGTEHVYKGKTYIRSYMGGAAFDHEKVSFEESDTGRMFKLYRTNRRKYYKKDHQV